LGSSEDKYWQGYEKEKARRQARKEIKRHRKEKRVRQKNWIAADWEDLGLPESERIMPPGERERRLQTQARVLAHDGSLSPDDGPASGTDGWGLVVEVSTGLCRVEVEGRVLLCDLRGSLSAAETGFTNVVAVGDMVEVRHDGAGHGVVEAVGPRQSALSRPDVFHSHLQQVVVANAEQLLLVQSWRGPAIWPELIDRYLIAAQRYGLQAVICLNKVDLCADPGKCRTALGPYLELGYQVLFTSALQGTGLEDLRQVLRDHKTVLGGLSGVGKSSLIAAIQPGLDLRIAEVSERRHEGRHTTAQVNLHRLAMGGWVVDTPGIREFGLSGIHKRDLGRFYAEFAEAGRCAYADCSHLHEPGCAVRAALGSGAVSRMRYQSYRKIYESLPD